MQGIIIESGEYGKALEALYRLLQNSAIENEQLIVYYDKVIQYIAAKGIAPIQTALKGTAKDFYIYYTKQPQHVITEEGQRKTYCGKSFSINGFLADFDIVSMLHNNWRIIRRTQYQLPKYYGGFVNYSNQGFTNLHAQRGKDAEKIPQQLYFAGSLGKFTRKDQDNRQKVAYQVIQQLQKYLPGGIYQARLNHDLQQSTKDFAIKLAHLHNRKQKRLMYKIPQSMQNFISQIGSQCQVTADIGVQYYSIIKQNYMGELLQYLHNNNHKVNLLKIYIKDDLCGIRADLSRSDDVFKMRLIKHLYVKLYGIDIRVKNAGSLTDLFQILGQQKAEILQKQAHIFVTKQQNQDCNHYQIIHNISRLESAQRFNRVLDIVNNWQKKQNGQADHIAVTVGDQQIQLPKEFIICTHCDQEIICAHKCIQYLLFDDFDQASQLQKLFKANDAKISKSHSFCYNCGEILTEREHFSVHDNEQQLDPEKKYSMYRTLFRNVLQFNITTSAIFNTHQLFKDMVTTIQPVAKRELTGRKSDVNYKDQKLQVLFVLVCSYFSSISGEQFVFSSKDFYQKNKKIVDPYDKFLEKVAKLQAQIKPLFILNNISAIQSLSDRLQKHPILRNQFIGCDVMEKLLLLSRDGVVDLRNLYFNQAKLPDLHSAKLDQLNGSQINDMILARISKYCDVQSQALLDYSERKRMFAQTVSHRYHQPNACQPSRFMPFKNKNINEVLATANQSSWLQSLRIFYKTRCPESLKIGKLDHIFIEKQKLCRQCGFIDTQEMTNEYITKYAPMFKQQFHNHYGVRPQNRHLKIHERDSFDIKYDELMLIKTAMRLELQPIQIINLCGFDGVEYQKAVDQESLSKSTKSNQKEKQSQAMSHQMLQKTIVSKLIEKYINDDILPQGYVKGDNLGINELQFITDMRFCWYVFRSRLDKLNEAFVFFISKLGIKGENITVLQQINKFHKKCIQSHKNHFVLCQIYISQFFSQLLPHLYKHNPKETVDKLLKELIERDKRMTITARFGALSLARSTGIDGKKVNDEQMDKTIDELFGEQDMPDDFFTKEEDNEQEGDSDVDIDLMNRADADDSDQDNDDL